MSCCPATPSPQAHGGADTDAPAQDTDIRAGESMDCYMRRSGNTTGRMDDKTDYIPDKIVTADIPLTSDASVGPDPNNGLQFALTPNAKATQLDWSIDQQITGITFSNTGVMKGKFDSQYFGKRLDIKITVEGVPDGETVKKTIDERTYTISPAAAKTSDTISFTHPLPGAVVTSKFGPRRPPASGASSQHGGADFALPGRKIGDVVAAADGTVEFTGFQAGGAGNYIKIKHLNTSNKHLCTTVYMHLEKIYVSVGQTVVGGQKIGLEGNTGVGTGAHLHFECRLPNGTKIDPVPLINSTLTVYPDTTPQNQGSGDPQTQNSQAVLTPSNVDAREGNCPDAANYPKDPDAKDETPVPAGDMSSAFEYAWFFTMTHEVGPHWTTASPNDPEVAAGLIETAAQRKKVGYVNMAADPGGETKFGVAQKPNPSINVRTITYEQAKNTGFNNYWARGTPGPKNLSATKPKTAVMLFDINYMHGVGAANKMFSNAGITDTLSDDDSLKALFNSRVATINSIVQNNPQRKIFLNGWTRRANEAYAYAQKFTPSTGG